MVPRLVAAFLAACALGGPAAAVTPEELRRHIDILASDAFEGRAPGTPGEAKTIDYIVARFQALGLEPGGAQGGWLQPVVVASRTPVSHRARFQGRGGSIDIDRSGLILIGREARERLAGAPVVFAGHASSGDLAAVAGAVALVLGEEPAGLPSFADRAEALRAAGAAAVLIVVPAEIPWPEIAQGFAGREPALDRPSAAVTGIIAHEAAARLAEATGRQLDALVAAAAEPGFAPVRLELSAALDAETQVHRLASSNVLGRLPGSGGSGETLLYLAHWDHLGRCGKDGEADRICNGAVDNASGVAALIEIARGLAAGPRPERDILFLATTAEELGLFGAEQFAADPPVALRNIVAALNLDTVAIAPKGEKVAVVGRGIPALDRLIEASVREQGRALDRDDEGDAFLQRQDGWALTRRGVPALMVGGSFSDMAKLDAFLGGPYHLAADNPGAGLVLDGAAEDADLLIALGRKLADPKLYRWAERPPAPLTRPDRPKRQ